MEEYKRKLENPSSIQNSFLLEPIRHTLYSERSSTEAWKYLKSHFLPTNLRNVNNDIISRRSPETFKRPCVVRYCSCAHGAGLIGEECLMTQRDLSDLKNQYLVDMVRPIFDSIIDSLDMCAVCNSGYHPKRIDPVKLLRNSFESKLFKTLNLKDRRRYNNQMNDFIQVFQEKLQAKSANETVGITTCQPNICTCKFGIPATGKNCFFNGTEKCSSCFNGYQVARNSCSKSPKFCSCIDSRRESKDLKSYPEYQCLRPDNFCQCQSEEIMNSRGICQAMDQDQVNRIQPMIELSDLSKYASRRPEHQSVCDKFVMVEVPDVSEISYTTAKNTCQSFGMHLPVFDQEEQLLQDILKMTLTKRHQYQIFKSRNFSFWLGLRNYAPNPKYEYTIPDIRDPDIPVASTAVEHLSFMQSSGSGEGDTNYSVDLQNFEQYFQLKSRPFYWDAPHPFNPTYVGQDLSYAKVKDPQMDYCGLEEFFQRNILENQ